MEENIVQNQPIEIPVKPAKPWLKIALFSALGLVLAGGLVFAAIQISRTSSLKTQIAKPNLKTQNLTPTEALDATPFNLMAYENLNHKFMVIFPYPYTISTSRPAVDDSRNFWTCFDLLGKEATFCVKINMNSEIAPPFLTDTSGCPICKTEMRTTFLGKETTKTAYSTQQGMANTECPSVCTKAIESYISNEHSVELESCLAKDQSLYLYNTGGQSEAELLCQNDDPLYRFSLICKGTQWVGKDGQVRCNNLFDQILSTFKFLD